MAPIIEVSKDVLEELDKMGVSYKLTSQNPEKVTSNNYIKLPSRISVSRERFLFDRNWYEQHLDLDKQGERMSTIPEQLELLKYAREHDRALYDEMTKVRSPSRGENVDGYFEQRGDGLYILTGNRNPSTAEKLDDNTLRQDRRISYDSFIDNPTSQGLPREDVERGEQWFFAPRNGKIARFYANPVNADFDCDWDSSLRGSDLGVRSVREK